MPVTEGAFPVRAWIDIDGTEFPIKAGNCNREGTKKTGSFSARLPMNYPGVAAKLATLGENVTKVIVLTKGKRKTLLTGEIDHIDYDYVAGQISVSGRDKSAKLHDTKVADRWINKKPDEIAKDLAGRVGLSLKADAGTLPAGKLINIDHTKLADSISIATILHKLAEFAGARWFVKDDQIVFKAKGGAAEAYEVKFVPPAEGSYTKADMLRISVSRNVQAGKTINTTVKSWNPRKKKVFKETKTITGVGGSTNFSYHVPGLSQDHVTQHAKNKASEHARHELTVSVEGPGDPDLDVSMKLRLTGTHFDQDFDIDSVHDEFGMSGHKMRITARSAKKGRDT